MIAIDLHEPRGGNDRATAFVYDYVKWGVNVVQADFEMPDNVALDHDGNLYITEDPATAPNTKRGDDILGRDAAEGQAASGGRERRCGSRHSPIAARSRRASTST